VVPSVIAAKINGVARPPRVKRATAGRREEDGMPEFDTSLTRLLGITIPLVQAPIGHHASPELVAAVANAGGLGMVSIGWRSRVDVHAVLQQVHALTDRPFGVNLVLDDDQHDRLSVCLEDEVKIVSLFWGDPTPYVRQIHPGGARVMHTVGSVREARAAAEADVDVIVAQGWEAGGHVWGEVATLPLVPRVVDAVAPRPVIAAGGISDGRGFAAALMLGAAGVWVGTRFLASEEASVHPRYQDRLLSAAETDTTLGVAFDREWWDAPSRTLRNDTTRRWEDAGRPPWGERPDEGDVIASEADGSPILRYDPESPAPGMTGDLAEMAQYAGQSVGLVSSTKPAATIVEEMATEAWQALAEARHLLKLAG
jgi:NAD(P)H-dependent flavin oxidoreductase YrpB (nitropropane dioxygenase family)